MRILFFDLEFANGQVPGSIYSMGYVIADEEFRILEGPKDLLIHPDAVWNSYVEENILAYPKEEVEAAPLFSARHAEIGEIFDSCTLAVGFALGNDNGALQKDCRRYNLPMYRYRWLDLERLCRVLPQHKEARGLTGCVRAWCGAEPENRHRSDGDAEATMQLLKAICRELHVTPEMLTLAYPSCCGNTGETKTKKKNSRRRFGRRPRKGMPLADKKTS